MAASAMVVRQEKERRRANGVQKPTSVDESSPLPPDWEIRHPRDTNDRVYYYNVKTEVSQWDRPVHGKPVSPGRTRERDRGTDSSQLGHAQETDVHPLEEPADLRSKGRFGSSHATTSRETEISGHAERDRPQISDDHPRRTDNRADGHTTYPHDQIRPQPQVATNDKRLYDHGSHPPSHPLKPPEPHSGRSSRPARRGSPRPPDSAGHTDWEASQGLQAPAPEITRERSWGSRRDSYSAHSPVIEPQQPRHEYEGRVEQRSEGQRYQGERRTRSPPIRRDRSRTPPNRSRDTYQAPSVPPSRAGGRGLALPTAEATRSRDDESRKKTQAWERGTEYEAYPEHSGRRPREPNYPPKSSVDTSVKRRRTDDQNPDSAIARRFPPRDESPSSSHVSARSFSPDGDQHRTWKRQPLPPQKDRFKEFTAVATHAPPYHPPPVEPAPRGPRDNGIDHRNVNAGAIPSGPRHNVTRPLGTATREHEQDASFARLPPTVASARDDRRSGDSGHHGPSGYRQRVDSNDMDVDTPTQPRHERVGHSSNSRNHESGRGYDFREDRNRDEDRDGGVPKGPRAMTGRNNFGQDYPKPELSPSIPPRKLSRWGSTGEENHAIVPPSAPPHVESRGFERSTRHGQESRPHDRERDRAPLPARPRTPPPPVERERVAGSNGNIPDRGKPSRDSVRFPPPARESREAREAHQPNHVTIKANDEPDAYRSERGRARDDFYRPSASANVSPTYEHASHHQPPAHLPPKPSTSPQSNYSRQPNHHRLTQDEVKEERQRVSRFSQNLDGTNPPPAPPAVLRPEALEIVVARQQSIIDDLMNPFDSPPPPDRRRPTPPPPSATSASPGYQRSSEPDHSHKMGTSERGGGGGRRSPSRISPNAERETLRATISPVDPPRDSAFPARYPDQHRDRGRDRDYPQQRERRYSTAGNNEGQGRRDEDRRRPPPPPIDDGSVPKIHHSRLHLIEPSASSQPPAILERSRSANEPSSRPNTKPVRIRRPSKFSEEHARRYSHGEYDERERGRGGGRDRGEPEDRPLPPPPPSLPAPPRYAQDIEPRMVVERPGTSLLERLNMHPTPTPPPSLRDRVDAGREDMHTPHSDHDDTNGDSSVRLNDKGPGEGQHQKRKRGGKKSRMKRPGQH